LEAKVNELMATASKRNSSVFTATCIATATTATTTDITTGDNTLATTLLPVPLCQFSLAQSAVAYSNGVWCIAFDKDKADTYIPPVSFLHRSTLKKFRTAITDGETVTVAVTRTCVPPVEIEDPKHKKQAAKGKAGATATTDIDATTLDPVWRTSTIIQLQPLIQTPNVTAATLSGKLQHVDDTTVEDSELVQTRHTALADAATEFSLELTLSRPLIPAVAAVVPIAGATVLELAPLKELKAPVPAIDVEQELRDEIDTFITAVLAEYARLFIVGSNAKSETAGWSQEQKQKQLFYSLTSSGVYHGFKEAIKPRIQRVVRKRLSEGNIAATSLTATAATSASTTATDFNGAAAATEDAFVSKLYCELVQEANVVLATRIKELDTKQLNATTVTDGSVKQFTDKARHLALLALDAECNDQWDTAIAKHEDRIDLITSTAASTSTDSAVTSTACSMLSSAWFDMAKCCLVRKQQQQQSTDTTVTTTLDNSSSQLRLDTGAQCVVEALQCAQGGTRDSKYIEYLQLYGAVMLESGHLTKALSLLEDARLLCVPELQPEEVSNGYDSDDYSYYCPPLLSALLCIVYDKLNKPVYARSALKCAIAALTASDTAATTRGPQLQGTPRRVSVTVMQLLCEYLLQYGLYDSATQALRVAEDAEQQAVTKCNARGLQNTSTTEERAMFARLRSQLALRSDDLVTAEQHAVTATELQPHEPKGYLILLQVLEELQGTSATQCTSVAATALDCYTTAATVPPLQLFVTLGKLYSSLGQVAESKQTYLHAVKHWHAPSVWLGIGTTCLQLEQYGEAEIALQYANRLDNHSATIWATLALLLLSDTTTSATRVSEATQALDYALKYGLSDVSLLRELGNAFVSIDRLQAAEAMFRRALAVTTSSNGSNGVTVSSTSATTTSTTTSSKAVSVHVRRRLADVLSAQNSVALAIEEYKAVFMCEDAPIDERQQALGRCGPLLKTLGRSHELQQWRAIAGM
jgi:tetratricopeptide (TPR) repeat protein